MVWSEHSACATFRRMNRSGHSHFNPWLALVVVCLGQFMVVLDATIVNVALPSIQADLQISDGSLQWIVNAYTLLFGGFLLLGGRAADLLGRRTLFIAGVVVFSVASFVNALATLAGDADRRARPAGPRRRAALPGRAGGHHDLVRRGPRPHARAGGVGGDRVRRQRRRPAAGRRARRVPLLGVDLLRQRADRRRARVRGAAVRARLARGGQRAPLRHHRRRVGDRRPRAARLHDRAGRELGLGLGVRRSGSVRSRSRCWARSSRSSGARPRRSCGSTCSAALAGDRERGRSCW